MTTPTPTSTSPVETGKRPAAVKIQAPLAKVRDIRVLDTDLVITLESGETAVVPDGAIRSMTDPAFVLQFEDSEVPGSALLRQSGRMEIGELSSVAVSTPARKDDTMWLNGSPARAAESSGELGKDGAATGAAPAPVERSWAEKWSPWATLGAGVAGLGIAAAGAGAGGGKGGATAAAAPPAEPAATPAPFTLYGTVTGGPVVPGNDLRVEVRNADGKLLGTGSVDASGRYQIAGLPGGYHGALLVTIASDGNAGDYRDEATGLTVDLKTPWRAVTARNDETQVKVNVTPVTELAVQSMTLTPENTLPDAAMVSKTNAAIAKLLGLGDADLTQRSPLATVDQAGSPAKADDYGRLLAVLSGLDKVGVHEGADGESALAQLAKFLDGAGGILHWKNTADDGTVLAERLTQAFNSLSASDRSAATLAVMNNAFGLPAGGEAPHVSGISVAGVDAHGKDKQDPLAAGDKVRVVLSGDASLYALGNATVSVKIGDRNVDAAFVGQRDDGALVFEYTVAKNDFAPQDGVTVVGMKFDNGGGLVGASGTAVSNDMPAPASAEHLAVGTPVNAADWSLASGEDTGLDATDRITQKTTLRVTVSGQPGNTVHLFDDLNGNGQADDGEEIGSVLIKPGKDSGVMTATLNAGSHSLGAFQTDDSQRSGPVSAIRSVIVDTQTAAPLVQLDGAPVTTGDGTAVALGSQLTLRIDAEVGSDVTVFADNNGNRVFDAADLVLARYLQTEAQQTVQSDVSLGDGKVMVGAAVTDAAGNQAASAPRAITVSAQPVAAPQLQLMHADDTGTDKADGRTQQSQVHIIASGQAGTQLVVFDDKNGNGVEDGGERVGTGTLQPGETSTTLQLTLTEDTHHLRAFLLNEYGIAGDVSTELTVEVDLTAPVRPTIELNAASDTGVAGDKITAARQVTLNVHGEAGASFDLYEDVNNNGVMDEGERREGGMFGADGSASVTVTTTPGASHFVAVSHDVVGNVSQGGTLDVQVIAGLPSAVSPQLLQLDARTGYDGDTADGRMINGASSGEKLTAAHFGLVADVGAADVLISTTSLTNLQIFRDETPLSTSDTFTLKDVTDGRITVRYTQSSASLAESGTFADADFLVSRLSATTDTEAHHLNLAMLHDKGAVIFADGSGDGGKTSPLSSAAGGSGGAGGSGADHVLGTAAGDLIFGDGSGGGGGMKGVKGNGAGGSGGGAADVIHGGDGNDVIFGDGFSGDVGAGTGGDGGYGGGGGGGVNGYYGGAAGDGGVGGGLGGNQGTGGSATLGASDAGSTSIYSSGRTSGGGGAGVGTGSGYSAEFDGGANATLHHYDNSGVASSAIDAARSAFLDGPGGSNGENRMFTQSMGRGDDVIDGGAGNDVIMGGNGNDRISGGTGNDVMYGRGGSTASGTDNDMFIWNRHDAGPNGAVDVIRDFGRSTNNADQLDVHALLEGRNGPDDPLAKWIQVINNASAPAGLAGADATAKGTLVVVDIDGAGPDHVTQQIFLSGTSLPTTDVNALIQQGVLIV